VNYIHTTQWIAVRIAELLVTARIVAYANISKSVWNVEDVCPRSYTLSEMTCATPAYGGVSARYIVRRWREPWRSTRYRRQKPMPMYT
jgi:hypothetical protein